jgi:RNA polymerase sigma factor (sigma-70 family)
LEVVSTADDKDDPPAREDSADDLQNEDTARLARAARDGAAQGDGGEPFAVLYERIAPALYTWADIRIRPGMRVWLEPGDLVQEVWCRALRVFPDFDAERLSFRFWIFRIAKNVLLEALRKAGAPAARGQNPGTTTRLIALSQVPDEVTGISRRLSRQEELVRFRDWVKGLERTDRELLVHHGLEGLSHAQVAERLELETEAVAKRWQRLRSKLEQQVLPREVLSVLIDN